MIRLERIDRLPAEALARRAALPLALAVALALAATTPAWAQYDVGWYTIDGGGAASSGGVYVLTGTIGQPDAGRMTGGVFALAGGFWGGGKGTVDVTDETPPLVFALRAPAPNPLVGRSRLAFELLRASTVELVVHDVAGRIVRTLASGTYPAGRHEVFWDASDANGSAVAPGVYFVRFAAGAFQAHERVLVLR